MKNKKEKMKIIVSAAIFSLSQAHAAETLTITSQFTPLEDLTTQDRAAIQAGVGQDTLQKIDWENSIIGKNELGKIEIRDKRDLKLLAHVEPTCMAQ